MPRPRLILILIAIAVAARCVSLACLHPLNWDEIEFFRATDWVRHGLVPYRDFWEHHTPLQWFLFAPIAALIRSPGTPAVIAMRWAQVPLWIAIFFLINRWMRDAGLSPFARWSAMALPLTSTLFMLPAVEYRVDVLAGALLIAALVLIQRGDRTIWNLIGAGAALCLSGFANLRMGPVLVLTMLMAMLIDFRNRRWGGNRRGPWIFAGAAGMLVLCGIYFLGTRSAAIAFRHLITENFIADKYAIPELRHMFVHRVIAPFGLHLAWGQPPFTISTVDPAGIILVALGTIAMIHLLIVRFRSPDGFFFMAFVQFANLLFISVMKFVFNYHLEIPAVLMAPLIAFEIDRYPKRRLITATLVFTTIVNVAVALLRGKEDDLHYQNTIMTAVDAATPPGSTVWDSVGWALRRRPAYRYWFLREIVVVLERRGIFPTYSVGDMIRNPPQAVVADYAIRLWLARHHFLFDYVTAHYLPTWTSLWLPGLSARLRPGMAARWIAPASGTYDIYASPRLANHPWFRDPLDLEAPMWRSSPLLRLQDSDQSAAPIEVIVNGAPVSPGARSVTLAMHDVVIAANRSALPIGVMIARAPRASLFVAPPQGVTIEASSPPEWHIPHLW